MENKDIDIYEILKGMPNGIELYTPMCGRVDLSWLATNKEAGEAIGTENRNGEFTFNKGGRYLEDGEVLLFPSNEMRDWSKFFKKGDVLEYKGENNCKGTCIFESYEDEMTKLDFTGLYILQKGEIWNNPTSFRTSDWVKSDDPAGYIKTVEEQLGGKLNRETLEIEKHQPEFKDGDIVVAEGENKGKKIFIFRYKIRDSNTDEHGYKSYINVNSDGSLFNNMTFYLRKDFVYRLATDSEKQQLFDALAKEGKRWNSEKKQIVDLKPAFEIGKLYVFDEEDEDGKVTVIGKLIGKEEGELTIGNQYEIENEKFVTDEAFFLNISLHKELREATELEVELFNKHCAIWEKKEKEAMEQPAFKTFDKVLVRCGKGFKWLPAFFVRDRGEDFAARYNVLPLHSGKAADFTQCIPYEGHEDFAFTNYDFVDMPF